MIEGGRFVVVVLGRPAPQGSKDARGREQSKYLPAWRAAVKRAAYEEYRARNIDPTALPLFTGPVAFAATFYLNTGQRIDSEPDLDKLLRSTWDALTTARLWEDDSRVVLIEQSAKVQAEGKTGALLVIRSAAEVASPTPATT